MTAAAQAGVFGSPPVVTIKPIRPTEKEIYEQMWEQPEYRAVAPGEGVAQIFLQQARPAHGASVIDLGAGTGRGALALALFGGLNVTMVDFAENCLDEDIVPMLETQKQSLRFVQADLTKPLDITAEYGFCTDVMEHIPPEDVDKVLNNCLAACQHVFFQISTVDDVCGQLIGHALHLTVKPYEWWLNKFKERDCVIHWSKDYEGACIFYVSAWTDGKKIVDAGVLNVGVEQARANVETNVGGSWKQVVPHITNDIEVMLLGGGPSLNEFAEEIKQKREEGVKLITLNNAYNWALAQGLTPSAQIVVDARPENARFTKPVVDSCKYLIASQCDPSVLEGLPEDRTYLWHTTAETFRDILDAKYEAWWPTPGGSTVLLRAIPLMRMLGYRKFYLYGCDSCVIGESHHAYNQPENDGDGSFPVIVGGRTFKCAPWHAAQAQEFMELIKFLGNEIELDVRGDGLLAWILKTGADLADAEEWLK